MPLLHWEGVRHKDGLDCEACLLPLSLTIRAEACADPLYESPDGPLVPLPARSYPGINDRPSLVVDPRPPHSLT